MVTSIYKWIGLSLVISLLYVNSSNLQNFTESPLWGAGRQHPFHVSSTEVNQNAKDKTLEITCRIFTDDFEAVLEKNYKTKVDLTHPDVNPNFKSSMDNIVNNYILKHLQLKADSKVVNLTYIGFEIDADAVNVYMEVENISSVKKVEVTNSVLYDLFTDQIGIIHVIVGGNRKSFELNYPNTQAVFQF